MVSDQRFRILVLYCNVCNSEKIKNVNVSYIVGWRYLTCWFRNNLYSVIWDILVLTVLNTDNYSFSLVKGWEDSAELCVELSEILNIFLEHSGCFLQGQIVVFIPSQEDISGDPCLQQTQTILTDSSNLQSIHRWTLVLHFRIYTTLI